MSVTAIIDSSAIIWDSHDYKNNTSAYYKLKDSIISFIDKFESEKPNILLRQELLLEMISGFPFDVMPNEFRDFGFRVYSFLGNINSRNLIHPAKDNHNVNSTPDVVKAYYNDNTKTEIQYVLTHIHTKKDKANVYFTFQYLWKANSNLRTTDNKVNHDCETVISDKDSDLDAFFMKFKRIFEHSPKHHAGKEPGDYESPLSCFDGTNNDVPQSFLDKAILVGKRYYNYDTTNDVYIVFFRTHANIYHGHDEANRNKIPPIVLKTYHK